MRRGVAVAIGFALVTVGSPAFAASTSSYTAVGSAPALPHGAARAAIPAGETPLALDVMLQPRDPAALEAFDTAVATKGSPEYHRYLSTGQFAAAFGPTAAALTAVEGALASQGLTVASVSPDGLTVHVTTTVAGAARAFRTAFAGYRLADGRAAFANLTAPEVPAAVAGDVASIVGLDTLTTVRPLYRDLHAVASAAPGVSVAAAVGPASLCSSEKSALSSAGLSDTVNYYSAGSLATAYGFKDLYYKGAYGAGVKVGLYEPEAFDAKDVAAYQSCYGTSVPVSTITVDGGPKVAPGNGVGVESALDIEDVAGLAPGASVVVYQGPSSPTAQQVLDTYQKMVTDNSVQVISTSWAVCEASAGSLMTGENTLFKEAAAQGQTVLAASGNAGSTGCSTAAAPNASLAVDDPASQPYVTAVGGATLGSGGGFAPGASAWSGSGGGVSAHWSLSATSGYQVGFKGSGYSNACNAASTAVCRQVPDVSALANGSDGYLISLSDSAGGWEVVGGTSGAAPTWAALLADLESSTACVADTQRQGELTNGLYKAASGGYAKAFADVTTGSNDDTASGYKGGEYPATSGYDLATGLGQPKAQGLLDALCPSSGTSTYTTTPPTQLLDTRQAIGVTTKTPVPAGGTVSVKVSSASVVPASGVTSIVLNVTVTGATGNGYATVYPDGTSQPIASNVNWSTGQTVANLVTVPVDDGYVNFHNTSAGSVHIIAGVFGYYTAGTAGSDYTPDGPTRVLDTRNAIGVGTKTPVGPDGNVTLTVDGAANVPKSGVRAVVLNITATGATSSGYAIAYADGTTQPNTSNLNWSAGQTIANLAIVPVGTDGKVVLHHTGGGTVHFVADIFGYYASTSTSVFVAAGPARVLDTRNAIGVTTSTPVPPGGSVTLHLYDTGAVPSSGVTAVALNVTVTATTASGYLTVYPDVETMPTVSNLNWTPGTTVPNLVMVRVGSDGGVTFHNTGAGTVHIVADLFGYFE